MNDRYYYREFAKEENLDPDLVHKVMQNLFLTLRQDYLRSPGDCVEGVLLNEFVNFTLVNNMERKIEKYYLSPEDHKLYSDILQAQIKRRKRIKLEQESKQRKIAANPKNKMAEAMKRKLNKNTNNEKK